MCHGLCCSETKAPLLNGVTHLGDCMKVDGVRRPVHGEAEVGGYGVYEGLITCESEGVGEVIGEVACVEKGMKVDAGTHHHQVDSAVMKQRDWLESRIDVVGDRGEVCSGVSGGAKGETE